MLNSSLCRVDITNATVFNTITEVIPFFDFAYDASLVESVRDRLSARVRQEQVTVCIVFREWCRTGVTNNSQLIHFATPQY